MKAYRDLVKEERFYIWQALRDGKSQEEIAIALDRHPSTISRVIKRNKYPQAHTYTYYWAMQIWQLRKKWGHKKKHRKLTPEIELLIVSLIRQYLSPEQIIGYIKNHHDLSLSHETIYRFIYSDPERHSTLKPYLRQGHKHRRKRYGSGARASLIPDRISITERPQVVEKKQRLDDWECDTVIGQDRKSVLVTLVGRSSLFTGCSRVYSRTVDVVCSAIIRLLRPYKGKVKTLTFDNGSEFAQHKKIAKALDAQTYFVHPYSSCERGINENTKSLPREAL